MIAGTDEAPGEVILYQGRSFKGYRGMGSLERDGPRLGGTGISRRTLASDKLVPEGIEGAGCPTKGPPARHGHPPVDRRLAGRHGPIPAARRVDEMRGELPALCGSPGQG